MCTNEECPLAERCYRKTANESLYQAIAYFTYVKVNDVPQCDNFWDDEGRE